MLKKFLISLILFLLVLAILFYAAVKLGYVSGLLSFVLTKVGGTKVTLNNPGTVSYSEAGAQLSTNGKLPEGFPKDFPLPSSSQITTSWKSTSNKTNGYSIIVSNKESLTDVFDFYKTALPANGWKINSVTNTNANATLSFEKDNLNGFIGFVEQNGQTIFSVTIGVK